MNADQIPDILIGGRSAELLALDGASGKMLWEYFPQGDTVESSRHQLYNFYNPQLVADQDGDQLPDILVANGGYIKAAPGDPDRPAGKLMLISSGSGDLIAEAYMPDGKETYMSCVIFEKEGASFVVYGSGGETVPGKLYLTELSSIRQGDLSHSQVLAESATKGFIAPPVLADLNGDGVRDIIANAVEGRTIAIDGKSLAVLWEFTLPNVEVYCSLAAGHFNGDEIPDLFTNYGIGQFPDLLQSIQVSLDGRDGSVIRLDSLGSFHYSSPVAYDIDADGWDEVFYHLNFRIPGVVKNQLMVFDLRRHSVHEFSAIANGANLGNTPLLDDLDGDNYLDIVIVHENNPLDIFSIESKYGLWVKLIRSDIPITGPIKWGSYMGTGYDGIY